MTANTTSTGTVRSADGTTIAYERAGEGPAVILIDAAGHFRGTGLQRALAEQLTGELTVYCYDRRGRGESTDTPPYAVEREVDDLQALIEVAGGSAALHGFSSGAVLAVHAAAAGLPIPAISLLEPPVELHGDVGLPALATEVTELVTAGRRADAYLHYLRSIGVPDEFIERTPDSPVWQQLQALAHTLAYDPQITATMTDRIARTVTTPALVVNSAATDERLSTWGRELAAALPNATHRTLPGEWHGVSPADLAPVLVHHVLAAG
ncbi:alpha/beta hydrolase [Saccharomonospora sp. NPDC046836]|uniref:alpha/beta fold hydrolase n=1 Tax=Saccharomonospora sp. NPDC046836 TaxID=3156921 RepID=UPI003403D31D